ncbi:hypothetical protein [Cognatiyoonia sp. IB215182]|uniref:hypothetical protein n=1 Tax=Cognatiyoonia sp. IB215182 TaxID=3097353 RepID=UPI002A24AF93|nr:hypothetical protein [Cognatiyoonia sp. IB215182]
MSVSVNGANPTTAQMQVFDTQSDAATNGEKTDSSRFSVHDGRRPPMSLQNMFNKAVSAFKCVLSALTFSACRNGSTPVERLPLALDNSGQPTLPAALDNTDRDAALRISTFTQRSDEVSELPPRQGPRFSFFYSNDSETASSLSIGVGDAFYGEEQFEKLMAKAWKDPAEDVAQPAKHTEQRIEPDTEITFTTNLLQRSGASEKRDEQDDGMQPVASSKVKTSSNLLWVPESREDDI